MPLLRSSQQCQCHKWYDFTQQRPTNTAGVRMHLSTKIFMKVYTQNKKMGKKSTATGD